MKLTITGNVGTISAPLKPGDVAALTVSLDGGFGPNHGAAWYVLPPIPAGRVTGGIVPFGTTSEQLRFTVPLLSGPVSVPIEVHVENVWTNEKAVAYTTVYLGPITPLPIPSTPPIPPDPDVIQRYVVFADGVSMFAAIGEVWDWLVGFGYIAPATIIGVSWTSTFTAAVVAAKAAEYNQWETIPTVNWLLPARVRSAFKVDTGIYLVAAAETNVKLTFYPDNIVMEVKLLPFEPWIRNIYADLNLDMVDLVTISGDVYATTIWATATQLIFVPGFKV